MLVEASEVLKADGFAVLSEFDREPPANVESEPEGAGEGEDADVAEKPGPSPERENLYLGIKPL